MRDLRALLGDGVAGEGKRVAESLRAAGAVEAAAAHARPLRRRRLLRGAGLGAAALAVVSLFVGGMVATPSDPPEAQPAPTATATMPAAPLVPPSPRAGTRSGEGVLAEGPWRLRESRFVRALRDRGFVCGDEVPGLYPSALWEWLQVGIRFEARALTIDDTLRVEGSPSEAVAGFAPLFVQAVANVVPEGITLDAAVVVVRDDMVVGVSPLEIPVAELGALPSSYTDDWEVPLSSEVAPGLCTEGSVRGARAGDGEARLHLVVRALGPEGQVRGAWIDILDSERLPTVEFTGLAG